MERLAVIDIGSNSIKLLVAEPGDPVDSVLNAIRETRISAGISGHPPQLKASAIEAGVQSVSELIQDAKDAGADQFIAVATSAVRDAANGHVFAGSLKTQTGLDLRILDGVEEARYIALGAQCDPAIAPINNFRMIDLGGGSMECITFQGGRVIQAASLPLGAVRLTEQFIPHPENPVSTPALEAIKARVNETIEGASLDLASPSLPLVAAGGGFNVARRVWEADPESFKQNPSFIPLSWLKRWRLILANLKLEDRMRIPGVPVQRADIMPAAVQVMVTVAELCGQDQFIHTAYNLRYGLAKETFSNS